MYKAFLLIFTFSCTLLMADRQQDQQIEQNRLQRQREDADRLKQQVEQKRLQRQREDADTLQREIEKKRLQRQIEEDAKRYDNEEDMKTLYDYDNEELFRQEILEDEPFNR